jgi:hypothetical protein
MFKLARDDAFELQAAVREDEAIILISNDHLCCGSGKRIKSVR